MIARILLASFALLSPSMAQPAGTFARQKALAGEWHGDKLAVKYEVSAGGAAVIETRLPADEPSMITVFHMDGNRLTARHYCSAGVHPRLRARAGKTKDEVEFAFVDAANMRSAADGHIHGFSVHFLGPNEISQTWTFRANGKDEISTLHLKRVKR